MALWAWGTAALGLFLALGRFNPAIAWAYALPGAGLLRYPVKFWTLAAPGLALLCGLGFARLRAPAPDRAGRRFVAAVVLLLAVLLGFWLFLSLAPATALDFGRALMPPSSPEAFVAHQRLRSLRNVPEIGTGHQIIDFRRASQSGIVVKESPLTG